MDPNTNKKRNLEAIDHNQPTSQCKRRRKDLPDYAVTPFVSLKAFVQHQIEQDFHNPAKRIHLLAFSEFAFYGVTPFFRVVTQGEGNAAYHELLDKYYDAAQREGVLAEYSTRRAFNERYRNFRHTC